MTFWRTLLPALLICPSLTFAASKEIVELQRDLALLQEQVRSMQRSQDEKFSAIQVLVQQALDSAKQTSTSVALLQNNLQQSFKDQQKSVVDPVVGVHDALLLILEALLEIVLQEGDGRTGLVSRVERLLDQHLNRGELLVLGALHASHLFLQEGQIPLQFDNFFAGCEGQGRTD